VVALGGAALGGALVATDRRSVGIQLEDEAIERRINRALSDHFPLEPVNIDVDSYNFKVLLTGQVPNEKFRADAVAIASRSENVKQVVDELTIGPPASLGDRSNDTLLSGKVRKALLDAPGLPSGAVKVHTTDGSVYLLGRVSSAEADTAARVASQVGGVRRVVKVFDLLSDAEVADLKREAQSAPPPESQRKP
jgi:osmotically-inducible protein OsmY